jgi:non-ribosomal peptide synthetase component F
MVHRARYGAVAQFFHSATAVFVLIAFTFGPGGSEQRVYAHARDFDRQLHETLVQHPVNMFNNYLAASRVPGA